MRALVVAMRRIRTRSSGSTLNIIVLLLLAGLIYQVWLLFPQVITDLTRVRKDLGQSGLWRSANYSQNQRFANYIKFIHENIPRDARVVLPSRQEGIWAGTNTPYMQFFLAPREVTNCLEPLTECIRQFSDQHTFILIFVPPSLPGSDETISPDRLLSFDQAWGILLPRTPVEGIKSPLPTFNRFEDLLSAALCPALWLSILVAAGMMISQSFWPDNSWTGKLVIAFGLALGFLSVFLFILMLAGFPLTYPLIIVITLVWSASAFLIYFAAFKKRKSDFGQYQRKADATAVFWVFPFAILGMLTLILSVGKAYHATDDIVLWGAKGYGIAGHGLVAGASDWGTGTTRYPLHIPLLIAAFKAMFAESLPASKLIYPLYYSGLLLMIYLYLAGRTPRMVAGLASLAFATAPIPFRHAQIAYANLPFTFYLVGATLFCLDAFPRVGKGNYSNHLLLAGIFFALASWTRPEGLPLSALAIVSTVVFSARSPGQINWKFLLYLAIPLVVFAILWSAIISEVYTASGREANLIPAAFRQIFQGNLHLAEAGFIFTYFGAQLLATGAWGVIGPGIGLSVMIGFMIRGLRFLSPLILTGLVLIASILSIYYLISFDSGRDISWWVSTGMNRLILPAITLIWIGSVDAVTNALLQPKIPS